MNESLSEDLEFLHRKRKLMAAMKSGTDVNVEEFIHDDELMSDKETVLVILQTQGGDLLPNVSVNLRDDEEVVFQACTNIGVEPAMNDATALRYASDRLKSSSEFVERLKKYWRGVGRVDQASLIQRFSTLTGK